MLCPAVRDGDWILVFRAKSSVDSSWTGKTMAAWNNDTIRSDDDLETLDPSCYANTAAACTDFFRSRWLGTWPSADIDQVRTHVLQQEEFDKPKSGYLFFPRKELDLDVS